MQPDRGMIEEGRGGREEQDAEEDEKRKGCTPSAPTGNVHLVHFSQER